MSAGTRSGERDGRVPSLAHWAAAALALAAAPIFALMAFLTSAGNSAADPMLCGGTEQAAIGGMTAMYLLMGAFHLQPWLRLIDIRRG
ncbi:hypothetical protein [Ensifer adhaerens]|uniref:hypothetical protein n=1 Tax=Ensifer adhaerens TaxID=106592 RepID=UPI00098FB3D8|nr:hypothetical protein [Ensifer adhaerens]